MAANGISPPGGVDVIADFLFGIIAGSAAATGNENKLLRHVIKKEKVNKGIIEPLVDQLADFGEQFVQIDDAADRAVDLGYQLKRLQGGQDVIATFYAFDLYLV